MTSELFDKRFVHKPLNIFCEVIGPSVWCFTLTSLFSILWFPWIDTFQDTKTSEVRQCQLKFILRRRLRLSPIYLKLLSGMFSWDVLSRFSCLVLLFHSFFLSVNHSVLPSKERIRDNFIPLQEHQSVELFIRTGDQSWTLLACNRIIERLHTERFEDALSSLSYLQPYFYRRNLREFFSS